MGVYHEDFVIETRGQDHILDITGQVAGIVKNSGMTEGIVCVFVSGSTGAITTLEYEPGLSATRRFPCHRLGLDAFRKSECLDCHLLIKTSSYFSQ